MSWATPRSCMSSDTSCSRPKRNMSTSTKLHVKLKTAHALTAFHAEATSPLPLAPPTKTVAAFGAPLTNINKYSDAPAAATCAASSGPSCNQPANIVRTSKESQSTAIMAVLWIPTLANLAKPVDKISFDVQGFHHATQLGWGHHMDAYIAKHAKQTAARNALARPSACIKLMPHVWSKTWHDIICTGTFSSNTTNAADGNC
mmetsp:Transcript_54471/g.100727  ORF Transcript_54471/g.100727 Transcript_54471/m.100727 type:complete len:202 (-) Transcript_54471:542-1147(-)